MIQFEVGKKYFFTSICDHNAIFDIEVIGRAAKSISYKYDGHIRRSIIKLDDTDSEYIVPDRYSMAPVFRASRELKESAA